MYIIPTAYSFHLVRVSRYIRLTGCFTGFVDIISTTRDLDPNSIDNIQQ